MIKIKMLVELEYDEQMIGTSKEEKDWFFNDILKRDKLILHSNEIGDEVGVIRVMSILK